MGGRRGASWKEVVKPKEVGGLGIKEYGLLEDATIIKDAITLWENKALIWARWMNDQYIQRRSLDEILPKQTDSSI